MSHPDQIVIPVSSELLALCQSQVALLTEGLGAACSAVYLTQKLIEGTDPKLIPLLVYPSTSTVWHPDEVLAFFPRMDGRRRLPAASVDGTRDGTLTQQWRRQIVLPLIHEDKVMGLLVTGREDREWNEEELGQIEKIARTLAIATLLDRGQTWYRQQFEKEQHQRRVERNRLDDLLHQLRNPLTALRTFSKLLLKRFLPLDRNQKVARGILKESDRLQELLVQFERSQATDIPLLPETNKSDSGQFLLPGNSLHLEPVSVRDILAARLMSAREIAREREINLEVKLEANLPPVRASEKALREVLSNLIDNALKYTDSGGRIEIEVGNEVGNKKNWQSIVIRDTGCGIPAEDIPYIFQRHYRGVQADGHIPGSGLGLAIAKELIEQMEGTIELISPNQVSEIFPGSTFTIWLPYPPKSPLSKGDF